MVRDWAKARRAEPTRCSNASGSKPMAGIMWGGWGDGSVLQRPCALGRIMKSWLSTNTGRIQRILLVGFSLGLLQPIAACGQTVPENKLYNELTSIMEERRVLWFTPTAEGGSRERDISEIVCPLVNEQSLRQMYATPGLRQTVSYDFFERADIYPSNTQRWMISRRIGPITSQTLTVFVFENTSCRAIYKHIT